MSDTLAIWLDAHFEAEVRFLQQLVRIPTDTPPGNNAPHAQRSAELLTELGFEVEQGVAQRGGQRGRLLHRQAPDLVPKRSDPLAGFLGGAQVGHAARGAGGHQRVAAVVGVERVPQGAQLIDIARCAQCFAGQRAQQAFGSSGGEALVLGQQARGFQGFNRLACQTGGLQLQAQGLGASCYPWRQFSKVFECSGRIVVS